MWLPSLTMGIGRGRQQELLTAMEKLVAEDKRKLRAEAIEECAQLVEEWKSPRTLEALATAIRALKDKP